MEKEVRRLLGVGERLPAGTEGYRIRREEKIINKEDKKEK